MLSHNLYAYCENNPVSKVDPDGYASIAVAYLIPGIGKVLVLATGAVVVLGVVYKVGTWTANRVFSWLNSSKKVRVDGWDVRVEKHFGKEHAHWKKGNTKGSVNKDGTQHHKGESFRPPKAVKDYLKKLGFKV